MIHSLDAWAAMLSESYGEDASIRMQFRGVADAASVVYVLQAIAVRRDCRGSGVFRALLTPILDAARQRETPVVLQTFKLDNLRKYEHMGFQLSKEVASDTIPLICYHMIHP